MSVSGSNCVSFSSSKYNKLKPSRRIEADAIDYRNNVLNVSSISVAVMIRTERMFRKYKSLKKILNCLNSIVDKYEELSKKYEFTNSMPLLTIDVGRFGTDMKCPYCSHDEEVKAKFESLLSHSIVETGHLRGTRRGYLKLQKVLMMAGTLLDFKEYFLVMQDVSCFMEQATTRH